MIDLFSKFSPMISVMIFAAQVVLAIGLLYMRSKFVGREEYEQLAAKTNRVSAQQDKMELVLAAYQGAAKEMEALTRQMLELKGELKVVNQRFKSGADIMDRMQKQMDRMDSFLRNIPNGDR